MGNTQINRSKTKATSIMSHLVGHNTFSISLSLRPSVRLSISLLSLFLCVHVGRAPGQLTPTKSSLYTPN